jgi:predicted nucleic acid-binding protein
VIVVDASLALELFLVTPDAARLRDEIDAAGGDMAAPDVFDLEILQTIRRLNRAGDIDIARAEAAVGIYRAAPVERFSHAPLTARIWALRENLTAYDAAYFALAEMLEAPLWTRDKKYVSAPGHKARVNVL